MPAKIAATSASVTVSASGSAVDDAYHGFSIRSLTGGRPVWIVNFAVDQYSFYIGALGGIGMGYLLSQYELANVENPDYYNRRGEEIEPRNTFKDIFSHIVNNPFHIIHRFFFSGTLYVLIGLATGRMIRQDGWGRPLICGSLTGLYLTYGGTFTSNIEGVVGFAAWSLLMEVALGYIFG